MQMDDELLAVRCQLGEAEAFDALVARWHPPLWAYARRLSGSDDAAGDAVQEIWLRVIRALPGLREPSRLRPWIFGIARRTLMDRLRAQYAAPRDADVDLEELEGEGDAAVVEAEEESAALHAALQRLPVIEREVLVLFYLRELSLAEIAGLLNVPAGTVKSRLFRSRQMLRAEMSARE